MTTSRTEMSGAPMCTSCGLPMWKHATETLACPATRPDMLVENVTTAKQGLEMARADMRDAGRYATPLEADALYDAIEATTRTVQRLALILASRVA